MKRSLSGGEVVKCKIGDHEKGSNGLHVGTDTESEAGSSVVNCNINI